MSEPIRLTVVTDNAARASLAIFGFRLQTAALEAPWCRFVDKAYQIPAIPDQAAVVAIWFDEDPLLEIRWFNERHKRSFKDDWSEQGARITDWLEKREAKELALIAAAATKPVSDNQSADLAPSGLPAAAIPPFPNPAEDDVVMSEITLFGPCSMTPARFAAMAPHLKTEAIRLFAERGLPVREMLVMTGATVGDLMAAGNQPHKIKLETGERAACPTGERQLGLSDSARFVLLMMQNQAGTLAASLGSIGYDIGKSESSVRDALKLLTSRDLIEMTVPASGKNHPAQYRMTKAGEQMAEKLAAEPAREARDA